MLKRLFSAAILSILVLCTVPLFAQTTYDWSMIGSAGVVDPTSAAYSFGGPTLRFATGTIGTIVSRYPVTNTYGNGFGTTPPWIYLILAYSNNSSSGSVTARLMRVDKCAGTEEQMCSISGGNTLGTSTCSHCLFNPGELDFANNTYYVEVTITRSSTAATPQVHSVAVGT